MAASSDCAFRIMFDIQLLCNDIYHAFYIQREDTKYPYLRKSCILYYEWCRHPRFIVRYLLTYIAIRMKAWNVAELLLKNGVYLVCVILVTLFFLIVGGIQFSECKVMPYDVNLTDGSEPAPSQCKIGLISDLHLGAGADNKMVTKMCEQLIAQQPDIICIAGDYRHIIIVRYAGK